MNIKGIHGMSTLQIQDEVASGARFVKFPFCISLLVVSFRFSSAVYFVKTQESTWQKSLPFCLLSLLFGWWAVPFGPAYTAWYLKTNISGGKNVTDQMMAILHRHTRGHVFDFERLETLTASN